MTVVVDLHVTATFLAKSSMAQSRRTNMSKMKGTSVLGLFITCLLAIESAKALHFPGSNIGYARYPKWNACPHASISFQFKTNQSEGLLMYTDDHGSYDYIEVIHMSGRVRVNMNFVDGRDHPIQLDTGGDVNDGRWHTVVIQRNRMETTLAVDSVSTSRIAFGSDFNFGDLKTNNDVFFGGLPDSYNDDLDSLSFPSALFQPRFKGSFRNIMYKNCSCQRTRASFLEGAGVTLSPPESCTERNPCRNGCVCVSEDEGPTCECSDLTCYTYHHDDEIHYSLPMDLITGNTIVNPSGLDATVVGDPTLVPGVSGNAIRLHTPDQYILVSGPSHRQECFGDLDKCPHGYTLQFFVKFENPVDGEEIFLSNGGHTDRSYGVAMIYSNGNVVFRFRRKNAQEWRVHYDDVKPDRWYHLAATWSLTDGLALYIDGNLVDQDKESEIRGTISLHQDKNAFVLGRSQESATTRGNRRSKRQTRSSMQMDEFNFHSSHKSANQIRDGGAIFRYYFPLERIEGDRLPDSKTSARVYGSPHLIRGGGKVGNALRLDGGSEYVDVGEVGDSCLGDLQLCNHGLFVSLWIKTFINKDNMYFLDSGNKGVKLYFKDNKLIADFQQGNKHWKTEWGDFQRSEWYFVELSWNGVSGAWMYINRLLVDQDQHYVIKRPNAGTSRFFLGRANTAMSEEKFASAYFDEVEIFYADRTTVKNAGLIIRDNVEHVHIPFEKQLDNEIVHPTLRIRVYNGANLVRAKVGNGVSMDGELQYTTLGNLERDCLGNLELCNHGLTMKMQIFPRTLENNQYFISSGPYQVYYKNNRLHAKFRAGGKVWSCSSAGALTRNQWQNLKVTWHEQRGLQMYVDDRLVAADSNPSVESPPYNIEDWIVYLGKPNKQIEGGANANAIIDEMEVWYAHDSFIGLWPNYVKHDIIDMDRIISGKVEHKRHEGHDVYATNSPRVVRGWIADAIDLDGNNQYINAGPNCSCQGNLQRCYNGYTLRARIKPNQLQNGMQLFSSAMYDIYYRDGKIWADFRTPTHKWRVKSDAFSIDDWSHMEWTWHPNKGLHMFVNGKEVATDTVSSVNRASYNFHKNLYVGRANTNMDSKLYGRFTVDDVQLWEAYRDTLVDNGFIDPDEERRPGDVRHDIIDMDRIIGNRVEHNKHPEHDVYVYRNPSTVRGWIRNAVKLEDGYNQYINVGPNASCDGNLLNCRQGFTLRSRVSGADLKDGQYLYSSPMFNIYYRNGRLWSQFNTPKNTWTTSTAAYNKDDWNLMEFTWHPTKGLKIYLNNKEVAQDRNPSVNNYGYDASKPFYIGRDLVTGNYGHFTVDDVQLWEAWREYLVEDGLIKPDEDPTPPPSVVKKDIITMDEIVGNTVVHTEHPGHYVYVINRPHNVQGWINNAVALDGVNQYINVGANTTCGGNLANCKHGFTLRSRIKPRNLVDNMYLYSSSQYDIYYRNGKIWTEFRTPDHVWRVSSGEFNPNKWNQMEWTWHPDHGLIMYVNKREVARSDRKTPNTGIYDHNRVMYIGRANTDMTYEKYGKFVVDDVQLWEAWRQYLIEEGLIDPDTEPPIPDDSVTTPIPTPTPTVTPSPEPENYITFDGTNWILYNMEGLPADQKQQANQEEFMVEFKTREENGLLWWSGNEDKNTHLSLKNGHLVLLADHGGDKVDRFRVSVGRSLADGKWHKVYVTRNGQQVRIRIDDTEVDRYFSETPSFVNSGSVLIGGYADAGNITNRRANRNFDGYIKMMHLRSDYLPEKDLFDLYKENPRQYWVIPNGRLPKTKNPDPVTFRERGSYIRLDKWDAVREGDLSFKFRTTEPNGLLLYNGGAQGSPDFFSVEMYDGVMYFIVNTGAGVFRYKFSEQMVNNGQPHTAKVEKRGRQLTLYMDGKAVQYSVPGSNSDGLDLDSFLYVGAVDLSDRLPWHLWTRQEKYYLGCLWDLEINNGRAINLPDLVRDQSVSGITPGCQEKVAMCKHNPCAHGRCYDTWNGAVCDCAGTVYTGSRCEQFANVVTFDGTDYLTLRIIPMMNTHTNDISLRFKTKKNNGLLFATENRINDEYIKALIENGQGKLRTNLGGRVQVINFGRDLSDDEWHTLYIKRRANEIELWVDDQDHARAKLPGDGYTLDVDTLHVGARGSEGDEHGFFAGWMQNFLFDRYNIFGELPPGWTTEGNPDNTTTGKAIPEHAVTLTHSMDSYATLDTLDTSEDMEVSFMFKTQESNGLLMYNGGRGNEFYAVELQAGQVFLILNDGAGDSRIYKASSARLDDDNWHFVRVKRIGHTFTIVVDEITSAFGHGGGGGGGGGSSSSVFSSSSSHSSSTSFSNRPRRQGERLDLAGALYIGGMPRHMYSRLPLAVQSRHGFKGCLASVKISGRSYNLMKDSITRTAYIKENCTATGRFCFNQPCQNGGICLDGIDTFVCDCNMTGYVGRICTDEPEGYRFGKSNSKGYYVYTYPEKWNSKKDALAVGFMSWYENGTIVRIDGDASRDFIEAKMENGHVVVEYLVAGVKRRIIENRAKFNDGQYHVLVFHRSGENATVRVDSYPVHTFTPGGSNTNMFHLFNDILRVKVGANVNNIGEMKSVFNGIIAGVYYNGLRVEDAGIIHRVSNSHTDGDVIVAHHPFFLNKPDMVGPGPGPGPGPDGPDIEDLPAQVPAENTGGGVIWSETHGGDGLTVMAVPGGGGAGGSGVGAGGHTAAVVAGAAVAGPAEGGRAAAFAGAFIGALLLASSLIFALYKLKPGALPCAGAGGGGGGAGKGKGLKISSPRGAGGGTNYQLVGNADADVANGGAVTGTGISMSSFGTQTLEHSSGGGGMAVGAGGAGGNQQQTQSFAEYFSQFQQSSGGVGGGGAGGYGTMTRGIQTDYQSGGGESMAVSNGYVDQQSLNQQLSQQQLNQQLLNQQQLNQQQLNQQQMYNQESFHALDSYQQSSYMQNTLQTEQSGNWQMQNMALTGAQNLATLAAEEIRVDCLLMTSDGRHVVTGSIYGPPQAWDLGSGELVRIMDGEELSSTDLHLACNDTLLVGQVAEMTQVDPGDAAAQSRIHNRKLQIWDFLTGRPLEMDRNELCTASCMMSDGERIVLGRTEKFGGGTTIVIYDLLANEAVRTLRYEAAVGFADFISYINLSKDNRYVIAGFQNSYDGNANFIIFDLTADSYNNQVEPKLLALDAVAECTAVLDNHEAVTGTRNGELLIWSMRTGKPLRQLVSATGGTTMTRMGVTKSVAHAKEVKAVCTSNDGKLLVSASADCTVKVWNLESERQLTTLKGHSDEVWCCTISADNDIIVSGSRDNTIRLWRLATASPICVYQTGVDVFSVRMSNNKRTIVALGDKFGARKLIMLRVVVTKTRSRAPSRATSPIHGGSRPTSPLRATSPLIR